MSQKQFYVYILTSNSGTLYIGITNNLQRRVWEHKNKIAAGFTNKYNINRLVYYETFGEAKSAIAREKQLKGWTRKKKLNLIESMNPKWIDFSEEWTQEG